MILDALKKSNSSLNNISKSLCNEDLKSVLNIHHHGLEEALKIANEGSRFSNPLTYLKFKVIDAVKDFNLSKKILGTYFKSQLLRIESAIKNPIERKQILENHLFKVNNDEYHLKVNNYEDIINVYHVGLQQARDKVLTKMNTFNDNLGIKRNVLNPFTNVVVSLEMQRHEENTMHGNRVIRLEKEYHDINSLHIVQVTTENKDMFKLTNDSYHNKLLNFEFTLYHELAHTSFNQMSKMTPSYSHGNEIHSDLCAIIKMIKNHDYTAKESFELCNEIFNYRLNTAVNDQYLEVDVPTRTHFTEYGLIQFTSILSKFNDKIKDLKDNEITDFVETFMQEAQSREQKILPQIENKKEFVTNLVNKYFKENMGDDMNNILSFNAYHVNYKKTFFEKKPYKLKDLYNDIKKEVIFNDMKNIMIDNLMKSEQKLIDIYLQNRNLEVGKDKLFIESLIKHMPDGKKLGEDSFEKFELYKQFKKDLNQVEGNPIYDKVEQRPKKVKPE